MLGGLLFFWRGVNYGPGFSFLCYSVYEISSP